MYRQFERTLTEKESRFLKASVRADEKRARSRFQIVSIQCLIGFGIAGIICILGKVLSEDTPPIWFFLLIFWGAGAFLSVLLVKSALRDNRAVSQSLSNFRDALQHARARVERIQAQRMIEIEEFEDEGACYFFEIDDRRLFQLSGQEYYSSTQFPSTDFSLIDILDSHGNPVASFLEKNGTKLEPCKIISATDKIKNLIPYDQRFIDCSIDAFEKYLKQNYA